MAWWSKAMAEPTRKALPMRLMLAMRRSVTISSPRSTGYSIATAARSDLRRPRRRPSRDCNTFGGARLRLLSAAADPDQRRTGGADRYVRRVDRSAYRDPATPYRGRWRVHLAFGYPCRACGAGQCRHRRAVDRSDRARDLDPGPYLSGDRGCRAERSRRPSRCGFRSASGLLGVHLRIGHCRQFAALRRLQARAGYRCRDLLANSGLERPRHLRAVRRWRWGDRARRAATAR